MKENILNIVCKKTLIAGSVLLVLAGFLGSCDWWASPYEAQEFNQAEWISQATGSSSQRYKMLNDLVEHELFAGMELAAALELLGNPDNRTEADGVTKLYYACGMPDNAITLIDPIFLYLEFTGGQLGRFYWYES